MLDWLLKNKEWLFSGLGVTIGIAVWTAISTKHKPEAGSSLNLNQTPALSQSPSLIQSPSITINTAPPLPASKPVAQKPPSERAELFSLSPWCGRKDAALIHPALSKRDKLTVCVARFKTTGGKSSLISSEFEASIEYIEAIHTNARPRTIERRVALINQARWIVQQASDVEDGLYGVHELVLAVEVDGVLYGAHAEHDPQAGPFGQGMESLSMKTSGVYLNVTLINLRDGRRWSMRYQIIRVPLTVCEVIPLRSIR